MDLRARTRSLSLTALPLGLCLYPPAAIAAAVGFVAVSRPHRLGFVVPAALAWVTLALAGALSGRMVALAPQVILIGLFGGLLLLWRARLTPSDATPLTTGLALSMAILGARAAFDVLVTGQPRAVAGQFHPNVLGSLTAMSLPVLLASIPSTRGLTSRALLATGIALGFAALVLSGSRGALFAFAAAAAVMLAFSVARLGPRLRTAVIGGVLVVAAVAAIAWLGSTTSGAGRNLLANAGFELGTIGWTLGGRSQLALGEAHEGIGAVALALETSNVEALLRTQPVPVEAGSTYTLSLRLRRERPTRVAFIRVEALDDRDLPIARVGLERWTEGVEARAGGPLPLPVRPSDDWQLSVWTLPPTPEGTHSLRLSVVAADDQPGRFALIDALQVEAGNRPSDFVPGPWFGPAQWARLVGIRAPWMGDPTQTAPDRALMWGLAIRLVAERPFLGHGLGAFREQMPQLEPAFPVESYGHSHSLYLELLLDGGTMLLMAVLTWGWAIGTAVVRRARRLSGALAAAAMGALIGSAIHNGVDVLLAQPIVLALLWTILAMGLLEPAEEPVPAPVGTHFE